MLSHLISLAIAGVLCALYLLFSIRRVVSNPKILPALLKAVLLTLCLGAFFLLPMFEQSFHNELEINYFINKPSKITECNLTSFLNLLLPVGTWDVKGAQPYPGCALLIVPILGLITLLKKRDYGDLAPFHRMTLFSIFVLFTSTDLFPWHLFKWFLMRIQFSWRFLTSASALLCITGAVYLEKLLNKCEHSLLCMTIVFSVAVISGFPVTVHAYRTRLAPNDSINYRNKQVSGAEYIPHGFDVEFTYDNRDTVLPDSSQAHVVSHKRKGLTFSFGFEKTDNAVCQYTVPLIYYYGYSAELYNSEGEIFSIPVNKDSMGLVQVTDLGVTQGSIRVMYEKTRIQRISEVISLLGLIWLFGILLSKKRAATE